MTLCKDTDRLVKKSNLNFKSTNKPVMTRCILSVAIVSSLLLVGCNDENDDFHTQIPIVPAEFINSFSPNQINALIANNPGTPEAECGVTIEKVTYDTLGAAGENTNATAALMVPTGNAENCKGDRPVLLYAHGTTTDKNYDFTQVGNVNNSAVGESTLIAANFAAQGYIVVAPNYAGYDESELDYHPYLVAEQQSTDMIDALENARSVIDKQRLANNVNYVNIDDSDKLYISGYSQGGHVAMATARMLESQDEEVTAIAPLSGPYALAAFGDFIFTGNVNLGATRFAPLLAKGLQEAYGDVYNNSADIFTTDYANTKLPNMLSFEDLVTAGQLPRFALFQSKPTSNPLINQLPDSELPFAFLGFAPEKYLIKTDFRAAYVADALKNPDGLTPTTPTGMPATDPQNNLRKALKDNDLRGYIPQVPTLLCGGHRDPTVYYDLNTGSMLAILKQYNDNNPVANLNITVLDVDTNNEEIRGVPTIAPLSQSALSNPWLQNNTVPDIQTSFDNNVIAAGNSFLSSYHGQLVASACTQATREFFDQDFSASQVVPR